MDNRDDIYIKTDAAIQCLVFTSEEVVVILESMDILKASFDSIRQQVRPCSQRYSKSSVILLHPTVYRYLTPIAFSCMAVVGAELYYHSGGRVVSVPLGDLRLPPGNEPLRMNSADRSLLADCEVQESLHADEKITCSHVVTEHDWPLYILGTSLGRVFIVPLSSNLSPSCLESEVEDEITCLSFTRDRLVSCFRNGHIDVWSLTHDDVRACIPRPRKLSAADETRRKHRSYSAAECSKQQTNMQLITAFGVAHGPIVAIVLPAIMEGTAEQQCDSSWLETRDSWQQMIIGQLEDGLLLVISISQQDLYCILTGIGDVITKATVNIPMEYLLIETEDDSLYVYNTMNQQLERVMNRMTAGDFVEMKSRERQQPINEPRTYAQQVVEATLSLRDCASREEVIWTECRLVGKAQFPILCVNVEQLVASIAKSGISEVAKFAISLLSRWDHPQTVVERQLQTQLRVIYDAKRLSISSMLGLIGVEECVSFPFPSRALVPWTVSPHLTVLSSLSLLSTLSACMRHRQDLRPVIQRSMDLFAGELVDAYRSFAPHSLALLALKSLEGSQCAYQFLKLLVCKRLSQSLLTYWTALIPPGARRTRATFPNEEDKKTIAPSVAIAITVLATAALVNPLPDFPTELCVRYLTYMIASSNPHYTKTASWLIVDGIKSWRNQLSKELVGRLTLALLEVLHTGESALQPHAQLALLQTGKTDGPLFCDILKREVARMSVGREYPPTVLSALEAFIYKHYTSMLFILPAVVEVIMRSLDQKDIFLRKICVGKATSALEQMVKRLPMVAFDPSNQRLAIGSPEGKIYLYNLSTASLWKTVDAHTGPATALAFKPGGSSLASYCMQEAKVRVFSIRASFFGLGSESLEPDRVLQLDPTTPVVKSTSELLEAVKIAWAKGGFALMREDKRVYTFD